MIEARITEGRSDIIRIVLISTQLDQIPQCGLSLGLSWYFEFVTCVVELVDGLDLTVISYLLNNLKQHIII